jgi:hypothetical protein
MDALSCTADKRVTNTPFLLKSRAPTASATVKVVGKATGTDAIKMINANGNTSRRGVPAESAYAIKAATSATSITTSALTTRKTTASVWLGGDAVWTSWDVRP